MANAVSVTLMYRTITLGPQEANEGMELNMTKARVILENMSNSSTIGGWLTQAGVTTLAVGSFFAGPVGTVAGVASLMASSVDGNLTNSSQREAIIGGYYTLRDIRDYINNSSLIVRAQVEVVVYRFLYDDGSAAFYVRGNQTGDPSITYTIKRIQDIHGNWYDA